MSISAKKIVVSATLAAGLLIGGAASGALGTDHAGGGIWPKPTAVQAGGGIWPKPITSETAGGGIWPKAGNVETAGGGIWPKAGTVETAGGGIWPKPSPRTIAG
ncbi:hypothetical protein [Auraticoccus monumenti]|uniref:Uncharacterized protein n=1 Tax=Auraticoccus monumenti TaxID=675864 RepID=A0A1G6X286_9ACTN|nr:hypothetical protein [Auraticoccus monumenti]SDD71517.1 hypothetical protein SAMN04489747_1580 [Auraticoccus monumenti]